jgi:hypothetical protein
LRLIKKAQKLRGVGWAAAEGRRIILDKSGTIIKTEALKLTKKLRARDLLETEVIRRIQ